LIAVEIRPTTIRFVAANASVTSGPWRPRTSTRASSSRSADSRNPPAGQDEGAAYVSYLRCATKTLIFSPRFRRLIAALVPQLFDRETLTGRQVKAIFRAAEAR
jgi:hypothetical protein